MNDPYRLHEIQIGNRRDRPRARQRRIRSHYTIPIAGWSRIRPCHPQPHHAIIHTSSPSGRRVNISNRRAGCSRGLSPTRAESRIATAHRSRGKSRRRAVPSGRDCADRPPPSVAVGTQEAVLNATQRTWADGHNSKQEFASSLYAQITNQEAHRGLHAAPRPISSSAEAAPSAS